MKNSLNAPFTDVWARIIIATPIKTLTDLATLIGKTQQTISASKQKNLFPYGWAYPVAREYGLLTEWLLTGEGPKTLREGQHAGQKTGEYPILRELEQWLDTIVTEEPMRLEWFTVAVEDAFPLFQTWKRHRALPEALEGTRQRDSAADDPDRS